MSNNNPIGVAYSDPKLDSVEVTGQVSAGSVASTGAVTASSVTTSGDAACANAVASLAFYDVAITANSTLASLPKGSIATTNNATGAGKMFISDGIKWQYAGNS